MSFTSSPRLLHLWSGAFVLLGALHWALVGREVLAQPPSQTPGREKPAGEQAAPAESSPSIVERLSGAWTCSMHPQIRQADAGKCPICAMELVDVDHRHGLALEGFDNLEEMIAAALRGSPEVCAAEARLRMAEAEVQQARLQAVERVVAYRKQWRAQQADLEAAEAEVQQAEQAVGSAGGKEDQRKAADQLLAQARRRARLLREGLAETEATLPFLLGNRPGDTAAPGEQRRKLIGEELLPKAEAVLKWLNESYRQGEVDLGALLEWSERVADLKLRLARTSEEQVAAVEAHRKVLEDFRGIAQASYQAGKRPITDVLAVDYQLGELKLKLLELRQK